MAATNNRKETRQQKLLSYWNTTVTVFPSSHFSFLATFDKGYMKKVLGPDSPLLNLPLLPTMEKVPGAGVKRC